METKRILMTVAAILLVFLLAGCVRPASQPPTTAPGGAEFPLPGTNDDVMSELERAATQTLMALEASSSQGTEAPAVGLPTATVLGDLQATQQTVVEAPTSTPIPVPTSTPGIPTSYTLQRGEHPYCIARRFNVNPDELLRASGLNQSSTFYAGMTLTIPQTGNTFPANRSLRSHPTSYTVQSGDTIYTIACLFGDVDPNAIIAANGLSAPYNLSAGQAIQIP